MTALARRVARTIERRALYGPDDRVAVALSGGTDSVTLLWLLREIAVEGGAAVVGLIHVNHLLRGDESDEDERFCRSLAGRAGLPIEVARVNVAERARTRRQSMEVAARHTRYEFFADAAIRLGATVVATGHTLDDQAETVLLRLLRGAGPRGLSGIRARRGCFVRPLIECRREELRQYLELRGETAREDSSNRSAAIVRNRVRHELVPVVNDLAPGGVRALARLASLAADDEDFLTARAIELRPAVVLSDRERAPQERSTAAGGTQLLAGALRRLAAPLGRRLVREIAAEIAPGEALSAVHLDAVWELAGADSLNGHLDLPGLAVERRGDLLTLSPAASDTPGRQVSEPTTQIGWPLAVPGSVSLPDGGVTITARVESVAGTVGRISSDGRVAMLQASAVSTPLFVRYWRAGDRFRPLGAPGRRKLQDLFVDRKVPRDERLRVPLVLDRAGEILWVAGLAVAEACRVTAPEAGMVILEMRKQQ